MTDEFIGSYTDWTPYDVPRLASFLDEDLASAWAQVATWGQTHELVSRHLDVLRQTRDALAGAWPPERSPAAAKFFSVLDQLIASMEEMRGVAVTNGATLQGILNSLDEAKHVVGGLREQWTDMEAIEGKPGFHDANWRTTLNDQAQAQMSATDQAAVEYYAYLTVPNRYYSPSYPDIDRPTGPPPTGANGSTSATGGGETGPRPPTIPSVPPLAQPGPSDGGPALTGTSAGPVDGSKFSDGSSATAPQSPAAATPPTPTASWSVATPSGRAMRPGGVIGPAPVEPDSAASTMSRRSGLIGGPTSEEALAREVNPVGGLLGGPMGAGVHGDRRRTARSLPPQTEWDVPKGVAPVLLPPPEPAEHDPGPGVIGIDR